MFHVEHPGEIVGQILEMHASKIGISLSIAQLEMFSLYTDELVTWNKKVNLTAITDPKEIAVKHFLDCLLGVQALVSRHANHNFLDIGSEAGFPGIPLKILLSNIDLYLLEKNKKKSSFLNHLVGRLKLPGVTILSESIEDLCSANLWRKKFMNIAARAINTDKALAMMSLLLNQAGRIILYRTDPVEDKTLPDGMRVSKNIPYTLPLGFGRRILVVLEPS